eukprot:GHVQ01022806.1.p1 GENE.GHVQ01022806.1~~GHVQ01022806.1.p1  ORF type:complete len:233 (-),score=24.45 GHVQ01022806.1:466-1164(-)
MSKSMAVCKMLLTASPESGFVPIILGALQSFALMALFNAGWNRYQLGIKYPKKGPTAREYIMVLLITLVSTVLAMSGGSIPLLTKLRQPDRWLYAATNAIAIYMLNVYMVKLIKEADTLRKSAAKNAKKLATEKDNADRAAGVKRDVEAEAARKSATNATTKSKSSLDAATEGLNGKEEVATGEEGKNVTSGASGDTAVHLEGPDTPADDTAAADDTSVHSEGDERRVTEGP